MRRVGQVRKRDANEKPIVAALEARGATVVKLSGEGVPDLLVGFRGVWWPVEVKWPRKHLTPAQAALRARAWFPVVETVEQAIGLLDTFLGPGHAGGR